MKTALSLIIALFAFSFESAQAQSTTADAYPRLCLNYMKKSATTGGSAAEEKIMCSKMTTKRKAYCVGHMIITRVNALKSRGWSWAPSYKMMTTCSQIQNESQYSAMHMLITNYNYNLEMKAIAIALRANTAEKLECLQSMLKVSDHYNDLESCVD